MTNEVPPSTTTNANVMAIVGDGGKYKKEAMDMLLALPAGCVGLIVVDGPRGPGVSIAALHPQLMKPLTNMLRTLADMIDIDLQRGYSATQYTTKGKR